MKIDLNGKTALVTGAAEGIGLAIAQRLTASGASVMINDLDSERLSKVAQQHGLQAYAGDASRLGDIQEMVDAAISTFGHLDLLVANAGITRFGNFLEMTEADLDAVVDLNLKGTFFLVQAAARRMIRQGSGGSILMISSNVSRRAYPGLAAYCATKAAINALARSLAPELGPHGIRVNALAPGPTLTERTRREAEDYAARWSAILPSGRVIQPEEIADTACFLLSEAAGQITGQTIFVDGGWTALGQYPVN